MSVYANLWDIQNMGTSAGRQSGNSARPTTFYKNRKKKWARSEKKDKNKCPFLKRWDLFFAKTHTFFTCDAYAAKHQNYFFGGTA